MIYTLTLNPSLDYIVSVKDFKLGATNRSCLDFILPGGKGINVAIVLNNLGLDVKALGFTAGFTGEALKKMVESAGIHAEFIEVKDGDTRINVKLRSQEETEINGVGPHISEEELKELFDRIETFSSDDLLVISGSIPESLGSDLYSRIAKVLNEKDIPFAVDATKDLLLNVLPYRPLLIKPNIHELEELFHETLDTREKILNAARKLQEKGAENVLVSMSKDGAMLLAADGSIFWAKSPKGELKNSVGAGDSMVAGFLAGLIDTGSYEDAFFTGLCTGSASAFSEALATQAEVEALKAANVDIVEKG